MFLVKAAYAQCPVCIVTVGGGMLIAKQLGIDDFLVSLWISGLNTAISFWLSTKIKNKILGNPVILSILMLGLTLSYFIFSNKTGSPSNQIMGLDKIIFGQSLGIIIMFLGIFVDRYSRKLNGDKILFPYQKVVFPVGFLIIFTLLFKLIFKL
ncbi:MAG: hypothetical protein PHE32_00445 [Candidatus Shapirobacteria bacterium]|nr:hypothetical protein [Candidatus Shapirobacteria bacterium]MDD4410166.1 hypothetical protein [Candidatus Shapirobacteria bacterium]